MAKRIDEQVGARAVRLVTEHQDEYPTQLGVSRESMRRWVARAQVDAGSHQGRTSEELAEIKELRAKVRRLESDNEVLKAATAFFADNGVHYYSSILANHRPFPSFPFSDQYTISVSGLHSSSVYRPNLVSA